MKKLKLGTILCGLIWAAQGIVELLLGLAIRKLNMLPDRYFAILAGVLMLLWGIVGALLFLGGKKKRGSFEKGGKNGPGIFRRTVACLLAIVMIVGCAFARSVVTNVYSTVDGITGAAETVSVSMSVYVLADDPASSIADASSYVFAYLDGYETGRTLKTIAMLSQETGTEIETIEFATLAELVEGLYQGQCNAIILNSAYVTLLEETEEYLDFSEKTRVLYTAMLEEEIIIAQPAATDAIDGTQVTQQTEPEEEYSISTSPFVLYISGSDTRDYYLSTSRSDVNILMVVNPETKQVLLINTPRDYYISNPVGGGAKDKLTHCGIYGISCSVQALEGLYEVDIRYSAQINFTGVETLVDAIGGIDVYSDEGFYALSTHWIDQGMNHLNGEEALAFARDRYHVSGGDNGRGRHQMAVIQAVIQKVTTGTTIIQNYTGILESISGMFKTDITSEEIGELVKMQLEDMASWSIQSYAVTGTGGSEITYSMPGLYCYVMYPDQEAVDYAAHLIDRVFAGENLTAQDMVIPN